MVSEATQAAIDAYKKTEEYQSLGVLSRWERLVEKFPEISDFPEVRARAGEQQAAELEAQARALEAQAAELRGFAAARSESNR